MSGTKALAKLARILITLGIGCYLGAAILWFSQPSSLDYTADLSLLEVIKKRGYVKCGVASNSQGFSVQDPNSLVNPANLPVADQALGLYKNSVGLEADMCRAIAIGLFGSVSDHLYFHSMDSSWGDRMTAVTDGTVDILFRGTGLHSELGITHNVEMSPIIYYDPIVLMTHVDIADPQSDVLKNARICSVQATFAETALLSYSLRFELGWVVPRVFSPEPVKLSSVAQAFDAMQSKQCLGLGGRFSTLKTLMVNKKLQDKYRLVTLRGMDSMPVVGVVASRQQEWSKLVSQSIWTPMKAQAQGVDAKNVNAQFNTQYWSKAGIDTAYPARIIQTLGNYAEMYQRHLGVLQIPSGPNNHILSDPEGRLLAPI